MSVAKLRAGHFSLTSVRSAHPETEPKEESDQPSSYFIITTVWWFPCDQTQSENPAWYLDVGYYSNIDLNESLADVLIAHVDRHGACPPSKNTLNGHCVKVIFQRTSCWTSITFVLVSANSVQRTLLLRGLRFWARYKKRREMRRFCTLETDALFKCQS